MEKHTDKKSKDGKNADELIDRYDYLGNSCSAWDCTGLIPFAPTEDGQLQSYEDLYHFTPPEITKED